MSEYELDLSSEDIGEIITVIRVQVFKMHIAPFAQKLGIKERVLLEIEDGNGPHGSKILKKITETFPSVKTKLTVTID
jgi:hypothetical protein